MEQDHEYRNRTRALELLQSWRGHEVSAIVQQGLGMVEYRGILDDHKQDGVWTIRAPGVTFQFVAEIPGAHDRYTVSTSENSIGISPRPGQNGDGLTIMRNAFL